VSPSSLKFRPRAAALLGTVLRAAFILPAVAASATSRNRIALTSLESGVLGQLNAIRHEHDLVPLALSPSLTAASAQHSEQMAQDGYFRHASFNGSVFWARIGRWYSSNGYRYWSVGENLLWSSPDVTPVVALRLWMESPEHRANILNPAWREIGVVALHVGTAPGTYQGRPVTIITTDFGVRR
jgi:uncharacterized protein YkwD